MAYQSLWSRGNTALSKPKINHLEFWTAGAITHCAAKYQFPKSWLLSLSNPKIHFSRLPWSKCLKQNSDRFFPFPNEVSLWDEPTEKTLAWDLWLSMRINRKVFGVLRDLLHWIYGVIPEALKGFSGKSLQALWDMCACSLHFPSPVLTCAQLWGSIHWLQAWELDVYISVSPFWSKTGKWEEERSRYKITSNWN